MSFESEEIVEGDLGWSDVQWLAKALPLFQDLDDHLLDHIASSIEWFALPGGTTLFDAGDTADALYFVISGGLGAYIATGTGRKLVGHITAGETVGEMALISGKPRNATVIALRDSELGRLSREAFDESMRTHPSGLLSIARLTVQRLESARQAQNRQVAPKTIAVVPHNADISASTFAAQLVTQFEHIGRTEFVWNQRGAEHTSQWFHRIERANDFVIYLCDPKPTAWTKLCLRQADALLLLARAKDAASDWPALSVGRNNELLARRTELVMLHSQRDPASAIRPWLDVKPGTSHHHVRGAADIGRLARWLTGRGLGVVLSGGGARGFAHIGVLRALKQSGHQIDAIGGTSIGAIIAAGYAAGWDEKELVDRVRRSFVATNPVNDYTLPLVSLVSGRKVSRLLQREFGDSTIEDLHLPFFCVSSNLSSGQLVTHRQGLLWRWLRASVSIPGVLPPVLHKGEVFVDGATINNLPTDVMREFGAGRVIGVDVGSDRAFTTDMEEGDVPPLWKIARWFRGSERRINILQILWRASMINSATTTEARRESSDLLLQPPLEQVDLLNWRAFDLAIDVGYRYAMERLEQLEAGQLLTKA